MTCEVQLLGTNFTLRTDENPEYLNQVIWYYKKKLEEMENSLSTKDPLKLSILTGFTIVDELMKLKSSENGQHQDPYSKMEGQINEIAGRLIQEIDQALKNGTN